MTPLTEARRAALTRLLHLQPHQFLAPAVPMTEELYAAERAGQVERRMVRKTGDVFWRLTPAGRQALAFTPWPAYAETLACELTSDRMWATKGWFPIAKDVMSGQISRAVNVGFYLLRIREGDD